MNWRGELLRYLTIACLLQWLVTLKIEFIITGTLSWWAMIVASSDASGETVDEGVDSSGVVVLGCVSVLVWHEDGVSSIVVTIAIMSSSTLVVVRLVMVMMGSPASRHGGGGGCAIVAWGMLLLVWVVVQYSWALLLMNIVGVRVRVSGLALLGYDWCGVVPFT